MKQELQRIGEEFKKMGREIRDSLSSLPSTILSRLRNLFSKIISFLRPKNLWQNLKSLRPHHIKLFFQNTWKWLVRHYPESTWGWLKVTAGFLIVLAFFVSILPKVPKPPKPISPKMSVPELQKMAEEAEPPNPEEGLHILAYTPGGSVPETIEGIKILFDHSMIPMTEVDPDKHPTLPMTIGPERPGQFVWYGTKGFLYRFNQNLPLATTFHVKIPKGTQALDGKTLERDFTFEFNTAPPQVVSMTPFDRQEAVPGMTPVKITFSQPMDREKVEKVFECRRRGKGQDPKLLSEEGCTGDFQFRWETDELKRDVLVALPKEPYPGDQIFRIIFPKDLPPKEGDVKSLSGFSQSFSTSGKMGLEKIWIAHPYPALEDEQDAVLFEKDILPEKPEGPAAKNTKTPKKNLPPAPSEGETRRPTGDLCFNFTNPIDRKSFETGVQVLSSGNPKPDPTFRVGFYYEDELPATEEEKEAAQTPSDLPHLTACINADLKFNTAYELRFIKPILDRAGQAVDMKGIPQPFAFKTMHAALEGSLDVTKTMLNAKKLPPLPFTSMNAERVEVRVIPCPSNAKGLQSGLGTCIQDYDEQKKAAANENVAASTESQPVSESQPKDPLLRVIPLTADYDAYHHGGIDLAHLYPNLKPGHYEVEATFYPLSEITLKKRIRNLGIEQEKLVSQEPVVVKKRILATETALAFKQYENQLLLWALDIDTGEPKAQLPIQVWSGETLMASGETNNDGIFQILNNNLFESPDLLVLVDDPKAFSFVQSGDSEGISPESFGLLTEAPKYVKNYFSFLHTDRPLYRPSQTVFFSGFLRGINDGVYRLPKELSEVQVTITDPQGSSIYDKKLPLSETGVFSDQWDLGDDSIPRGRYWIELQVSTMDWKGAEATQTFRKAFYVMSYKKPDFKVSLAPEQTDYVSGETIHLKAKGSYFFGAPLSNTFFDWSLRQEGFRFQPEKFKDYLFVDEDEIEKLLKRSQDGSGAFEERESYEGDYQEVAAGVYSTDSDSRIEDPKVKGNAAQAPARTGLKSRVLPAQEAGLGPDGLFEIEYTPNLESLPTSQIYTGTLTAHEWGQEVSAVSDLRIHKSGVYVGLKPERHVVAKGEKMNVDLVTLNPQAEPVARQAVQVQIFKRDYMTVKKRTKEGTWVFESEPKDTHLKDLTLTTDANGKGSFSEPAAEGGTYRFVATTQDQRGNVNTAALPIGVGGEADSAWKMHTEDRVTLSKDKDRYHVGETAQILIPFPTTDMRGLLTIERAGVRKFELIKFEGGKNLLSVPIQEGDVPNIYVGLILFRPQGTESAAMKVGEVELPVDPDKKRLTIALTPEKAQYSPKEKVKISVKTTDSTGKGIPADLIVSVADESVLRLIDYESPDLVSRFYFPRKIGVTTAENMIHYKSGDMGEVDAVEKKKRAKFLDTAFFSGTVHTNASGEGAVEFTLPDNITTWVTEAFGISEDTKVGSRNISFQSSLPTFLRPSLPSFLAVEDEAHPILFIENPSDERFEGSVGIRVGGEASLTGPPEQKVSVEPRNRTMVSFGLKGTGEGETSLSFIARNASSSPGGGSPVDVLEKSIPVYDRSEPILYTAGGATQEVAVERLTLPEGIRSDRGGFEISVGTMPLRSLRDGLRYLFAYPYGCAEQRESALLGLWQLIEILKGFEGSEAKQLPQVLERLYGEFFPSPGKTVDSSEIKKALEKGLSEIYAFQQSTGGFSFWKEDSFADPFLTADMAKAFRLIQITGVTVDANSVQRIVQFLKQLLEHQAPLPPPPNGKKFALQAEADGRAILVLGLTLDPQVALPFAQGMLELKNSLGPRGLTSLALAARSLGGGIDKNQALSLVTLLEKQAEIVKSPQGDLATWRDPAGVWDPVTTTAMALQALTIKDPGAPLAESAARYLLGQGKRGNFGNTKATREALIALWSYATAPRKGKSEKIPVTMALGEQKKTLEMPADSPVSWWEETRSIEELMKASMPFTVKVEKPEKTPGTLYYQSTLTNYFPMSLVPRREEGMILGREFYAMDDKREEKPLTQFKVGENYKATLTLMVPQRIPQLVVEHKLPAGLEAVDFGFSTTNPDLKTALQESEAESPSLTPNEFSHEEIHDDRVMWYAGSLPAGIYKIRHVVRATTQGQFQAPGALSFPFYDNRYFARSRSMVVQVAAP